MKTTQDYLESLVVDVLGGTRHAHTFAYRSHRRSLAEAVTLKNAAVALQHHNATGRYPVLPWSHGQSEREMIHALLLEGWTGPQPTN